MTEGEDALTRVEVGVPGRTARRASAAYHPVGEIDPVALAAEAATALCRDAEPFDGGLCWGVGQAAGWPPMYSPDLYDGTAGVVLALAAAAQATGEARLMDVAKAGAAWPHGRGWSRRRARRGLHCGEGAAGW